jgi:hypothetical protein
MLTCLHFPYTPNLSANANQNQVAAAAAANPTEAATSNSAAAANAGAQVPPTRARTNLANSTHGCNAPPAATSFNTSTTACPFQEAAESDESARALSAAEIIRNHYSTPKLGPAEVVTISGKCMLRFVTWNATLAYLDLPAGLPLDTIPPITMPQPCPTDPERMVSGGNIQIPGCGVHQILWRPTYRK